MALKKKYLKNKPICKVTFTIPKEIGERFKTASVLGDFNQWDINANIMLKLKKDRSFSTTIDLDKGKEYKFRYLLDGEQWANEPDADDQILTHFGNSKNSVIKI